MQNTNTSPSDETATIRKLNDSCRRQPFSLTCTWLETSGIAALPSEERAAIREKVTRFDNFTLDNDPHGEHDFGAFEHNGERIFWKIDYYAPDMQHGSDDPSDESMTRRVLTVMLASEY